MIGLRAIQRTAKDVDCGWSMCQTHHSVQLGLCSNSLEIFLANPEFNIS